jgi:hypothetical protein
VQDGHERHVWGKKEYIEAGSIIKVKGTDTEDQEANVMVFGAADFKLKEDTDSEVILFASSSDTQMKFAMLTIPRDKQRRWPDDEGGIQHPLDPEFALHFAKELAHITKNKFAVGEKGEFEVKGGEAFFRVSKLIVDGELIVNKRVKTPEVVNGTENPPGFKGNKQEEKKQSGGGGGAAPTLVSVTDEQQLVFNFTGTPTQLSLNLIGGA